MNAISRLIDEILHTAFNLAVFMVCAAVVCGVWHLVSRVVVADRVRKLKRRNP